MVGLRTQEDSRFINFFEQIQEKAKQLNSVFFLNCGEGHSSFEDDIICTDCSGWLVPLDVLDDFQKDYESFNDSDKWDEFSAWVTWKISQSSLDIDISLI